MRAAGLHAIATVLDTEAVLIKSRATKHPEHLALIGMLEQRHLGSSLIYFADRITARIAGVIAANKYVACQYNIPREKLAAATVVTPGRKAPTVGCTLIHTTCHRVTGSIDRSFGGRELGCCERDGRKEAHRRQDGRARADRGGGYLDFQHRQLQSMSRKDSEKWSTPPRWR